MQTIFIALINNAALLIMLTVVVSMINQFPLKLKNYETLLSGIIISIICTVIMMTPFELSSGIVFDSRTILISTTAYFLGLVPTAITVIVASAIRLHIGGLGAIPGAVAIFASAIIGIVWKKYISKQFPHFKYLSIYAMSVVTQVVVLMSLLLFLPYPDNQNTVEAVAIPLLVLYPIITVLLSYIILYQQTLREVQVKVMNSEDRFRSLFEEAPIGYQSLDFEGKILEVNQRWTEILGYSKAEVIGTSFGDYFPKDKTTLFIESFPHFKETGYIHSELSLIHKSGKLITAELDGRVSYNRDGSFKQTHCIIQDISLRKETEAELKESERSKAVFLSNLPGMAYRCNNDTNWTMKFVSAGAYALTGYTSEELINNKLIAYNDIISKDYQSIVKDDWVKAVENNVSYKGEYEIITKEGSPKWVLELGEPIYNAKHEIEALEGIIIDISDRKDLETEILFSNSHDPLTGLHNLSFLKSMIETDTLVDTKLNRALISINLNRINFVSMQYGYTYTQNLIVKIAQHLKDYNTKKFRLYHTHENRFTYFVKDYEDKVELQYFCENIIEMLKSLLVTERFDVGLGVIEFKVENNIDFDEILKNLTYASEIALEEDNAFGYCFYDEELERKVVREQYIQTELENIINSENAVGLVLNYQPIIDIRNSKIVAFEALARIQSQRLGAISPTEFISIAEKTKLIIPLGEQITIKAFEFIKKLNNAGLYDLMVSINVSVIQLMSENFNRRFISKMTDMHIDPKNIEIEVTESIFSGNMNEVNRILGELRHTGISIAIDDFGIGYSSLSRESELQVDVLKIDQSFIRALEHQDEEASITSDIISMAHKLNNIVVAEGVETDKQLEFLKHHHCDYIQGYYFSKPLTESDALEYLNKHI